MSAVKLFGKTIGLPPETIAAAEVLEPAKQITSNPNPKRQRQSGPKLEESKEPNAPDNSTEESTELDEKATLKKPDVILPCPRCNSMETKFCYFNNYNVNQPRHFCRKCQRYWTAGGIMRNVPVGAGRRKNKNIITAASHVSPLTVPVNHPNGTILVFNSDTGAPLGESMVSVLSVDKTVRSGEMDGGGCSSSDSCSKDEVPVFREGAWPYPCQNPTIQWTSPASHPTFSPAMIPLTFYATTPPPCWTGPTICNVPFVITPPVQSSPTLGKHARDENIPKPQESSYNNDNLETSLWVPKTLRVDDSREADKSSSVWANLGMNNDTTKNDDCVSVGIGVGSLFKAFQSQTKVEQKNEKTNIQETPAVLQANPAALSRSVSFHESS